VARKRKCKVFVSYSRHDEALVKPLASLPGAAANDAVFFDVTSLKAGDLWEEAIFTAVKEASVFVVCWCCESQKSSFVAREISAALSEGNKKLIPVLFCSTPLPPHLANRQWTDLRGKVMHECPEPHPKKEERPFTPTMLTPRSRQEVDDDFSKQSNNQSEATALEDRPPPRPEAKGFDIASFLGTIFGYLWVIGGLLIGFAFFSQGKTAIALLILGICSVILFTLIFAHSTLMWERHADRPEVEGDVLARRARAYFEGLGKN
jgi:hypothetical protein